MTMPRRAAWPPVLRNSYLAALPARGADSRGVLHPCEDKEKAKKRRAKNVEREEKTGSV